MRDLGPGLKLAPDFPEGTPHGSYQQAQERDNPEEREEIQHLLCSRVASQPRYIPHEGYEDGGQCQEHHDYDKRNQVRF